MTLGPALPAHVILRERYQRTLELGLAVAITVHVLALLLYPPVAGLEIQAPVIRFIPEPIDQDQIAKEYKILEPEEVPLPSLPAPDPLSIVPDDVPIPLTTLAPSSLPNPVGAPVADGNAAFIPLAQEMPEILHKVDPVYPELTREAGAEGTVVVELVIGITGRVESARVIHSDTIEALQQSALVAVRQWVFRPAMQGSHPTAVRLAIPFTFALRN